MSKPIPHILQVVPYFYPAWAYGGIPRLAYGLSCALVRAGARVTVLTTDVLDAQQRLVSGSAPRTLEGVQVITLRNLSNRLAYHHQAFLPLGVRAALEQLEQDPPDVIHLHGHRHLLNTVALTLARRCWPERMQLPLVMTPNGTLPAIERKQGIKAVYDRLLGQRVLDAVAQFIAVSRAEVAQLRQAGISAHRVAVIPNGISLDEFEPLPPRGQFRARFGVVGPLVLYLGKLTPRKGVDHLVEALLHLPPDVQLVIAGNDMGVEQALRAQRSRLGLESRVHFVGLLTGAERLAALADADVLAYPSTHEIFGLVPFEGLLAGAPVVVSDDCGCGELVHEARAGVLVPYGQPRALALALEQLLQDRTRGQAMVARGRAFIRSHFDWSRIADKTLEVYRLAQQG